MISQRRRGFADPPYYAATAADTVAVSAVGDGVVITVTATVATGTVLVALSSPAL